MPLWSSRAPLRHPTINIDRQTGRRNHAFLRGLLLATTSPATRCSRARRKVIADDPRVRVRRAEHQHEDQDERIRQKDRSRIRIRLHQNDLRREREDRGAGAGRKTSLRRFVRRYGESARPRTSRRHAGPEGNGSCQSQSTSIPNPCTAVDSRRPACSTAIRYSA